VVAKRALEVAVLAAGEGRANSAGAIAAWAKASETEGGLMMTAKTDRATNGSCAAWRAGPGLAAGAVGGAGVGAGAGRKGSGAGGISEPTCSEICQKMSKFQKLTHF
jgi:hypothetical protein